MRCYSRAHIPPIVEKKIKRSCNVIKQLSIHLNPGKKLVLEYVRPGSRLRRVPPPIQACEYFYGMTETKISFSDRRSKSSSTGYFFSFLIETH